MVDLEQKKAHLFQMLSIARQRLILKFPFTGNMSMKMDIVPIRDRRVRTACTDGTTIYFDLDFGLNKLNDNERMFVLAHEIWHCIMLHLGRCGSRTPTLFNIASDMEVNYLLKQQASGKPNDFAPPKDLLFPPSEMEGESAETIYEYLLSKDPSTSDWSSSEDGNITGQLTKQFDTHYSPALKDYAHENQPTVKDAFGDVEYDPAFVPSMPKDFTSRMRETLITELQKTKRMKGTLPAEVELMLNHLLTPTIDWRQQLCSFVTSCNTDKKSWTPLRRQMIWSGMY